MLLFEPDYIRHLIEIGERDAEAQLDEIGVLLGEGTTGEQAEG
jgi:hypothetical protein